MCDHTRQSCFSEARLLVRPRGGNFFEKKCRNVLKSQSDGCQVNHGDLDGSPAGAAQITLSKPSRVPGAASSLLLTSPSGGITTARKTKWRQSCWASRRGCQSGGACKVAVHASLIQSKSIKVKSQVPIEVLLGEEGIEPERSPWKAFPFRHNFSLLQQRPRYWPYTDTLMKDRISPRRSAAPGDSFSSPHFAALPPLSHRG